MANYVSFYKETVMKIYAILFDMVRKNVGMEDFIKAKGLHCADFITNSWTATTLSSMFSGVSPSELYPMKGIAYEDTYKSKGAFEKQIADKKMIFNMLPNDWKIHIHSMGPTRGDKENFRFVPDEICSINRDYITYPYIEDKVVGGLPQYQKRGDEYNFIQKMQKLSKDENHFIFLKYNHYHDAKFDHERERWVESYKNIIKKIDFTEENSLFWLFSDHGLPNHIDVHMSPPDSWLSWCSVTDNITNKTVEKDLIYMCDFKNTILNRVRDERLPNDVLDEVDSERIYVCEDGRTKEDSDNSTTVSAIKRIEDDLYVQLSYHKPKNQEKVVGYNTEVCREVLAGSKIKNVATDLSQYLKHSQHWCWYYGIMPEDGSEVISYVGMCADIIHHGHLNIIREAKKYGNVMVGLLTDSAIASYKRLPTLTYNQRYEIIKSIVGVHTVVPQETLDYIPNLEKYKPKFVVHGDDWLEGVQKQVRQKVSEKLKEWDGEIVDVPYTQGISSTKINNHLKEIGTTPDIRRTMLLRLLEVKPIVRVLETHNGLTGLIVEKTKVGNDEFDAMWLSSLTHSTSKGKRDNQYVDITTVSQTLSEIFDVTTKPMIVDLDNGGMIEHFKYTVRTLERMGVSAVIIEDKIGNKRNSLFEDTSNQKQDEADDFAEKISEGKKSLVTEDFMIIARIESLILGKGFNDALDRARTYIDSGADGIMIHSKEKDIKEVITFCIMYKKFDKKVPLVVVPTTYNQITEKDLIDAGVDIVIYANHLLRSSYPAMVSTAKTILKNKRSYECDSKCLPIKDILELIPDV